MELIDFSDPAVIWLLVGIGLIISEFAIPGFVTIFFGVGALITSLFCWLIGIPLSIQIIIFIITSVTLFYYLRKHLHDKFFNSKVIETKSDVDFEFIGKEATALTNISTKGNGRVEFRGTQWTAISTEDIKENSQVIITDKNNLTLTIKNK